MKSKLFHIRCTIERGGFSSERTFEVRTSDGGKLVGTADIQHLCDENQEPLGDDEPPCGVVISGYVKCRLIRQGDNQTVLVDLPSDDVIYVRAGELLECAH